MTYKLICRQGLKPVSLSSQSLQIADEPAVTPELLIMTFL